MKIEVHAPNGETVLDNVETWWYYGSTLVVECRNGETTMFPNGNVMRRLF
jgi:hypothetical protein